MIEVHDASYHYKAGRAPAVNGVTITIEPGDFVAVLGRNGSGKSTLAKLLNGILVPVRGSVKVLGMDTRDICLGPSIRQQVGLLFSNPDNQLVSSIVEEDVAFGPENLGLPPAEARRRVDNALTLVGMQEYRKHPLHLLSGGQKQRVAIAGLLAMKPRFMVLDEPTSMLDIRGRKEVIDTLVNLNRSEGVGIILITHFMEEVVWAKRVLVMDKGSVRLAGTPQDILARAEELTALGLEPLPATRLVAELNRRGFAIDPRVHRVDELAEILCQST